MKQAVIILGLLLTFLPAAQMPKENEQQAGWERGQTMHRKFVHRLFSEAGFAPVAEMQAEGREVRRLLLQDPYMMLGIPGIELERLGDGRVTLRLQYREWTSKPTPVDRAVWDRLAAQEPAVFVKPEYKPAPAEATQPPPPPPVCHGWMARFEADY